MYFNNHLGATTENDIVAVFITLYSIGEGAEDTRHFCLVHQTEHYRNVIEIVSVQAPSKWFVHLCSTILPAGGVPRAEYNHPK